MAAAGTRLRLKAGTPLFTNKHTMEIWHGSCHNDNNENTLTKTPIERQRDYAPEVGSLARAEPDNYNG
ncbi:hypothetical protein MRX96_014119 [Rhipicephalus microplus]